MAMARNLEIAAGVYDPLIACEGVTAAEGSFDTLLTAEFSGGHEETPSTFSFTGSDVNEEDLFGADLSLSRRTRSGADLSLVFHSDRLLTNSAVATVNPRWLSTLSVEATQPLLRGAGDVALADVRRAKNGWTAANHGLAALAEDVLLRVESAYWELAFATEQVTARKKAEEVAANLLELTQARVDAHVGTPLDLAEARAGLESRRGDRIAAEGARGSAEDALRALILPFEGGRPLAVSVTTLDDPRTPTPGTAVTGADDEERWVAQALRGRPDLLAKRAEFENLDIDVAVARNELLPQLDLFGRLSTDGLASALSGSWGDTLDGEAQSATLGLRFSVYLGRRTARANLRAAEHARRRDALTIRELENRVVQDVRAALRDEATARARWAAASEEIRSGTETLEGEREREKRGESTPFRVLEKEELRTQAVTREGRSAADARLARARLWKAVGMLAATHAVRLPDPCEPR